MVIVTIISLVLLFKRLEAGPISFTASNRPCVDFMLPVPATAQNAEYNITQVNNNIDATTFAVDLDTWSSPNASDLLLRNITVSDTFNISVQLCVPQNGTKKNHLQIATHGLGFDKRYWDVTVNSSEYSYVDAALAGGYSILTYDRLGTGSSDKPDANTVVQAPLQLEILRSITQMARSGELLKRSTGTGNPVASTAPSNNSDVSFDKIIHVGHSFGSILTLALLTTYGGLSDGAVSTGYILNDHFQDMRRTGWGFEYAAQNDATLFGDRSSGYIVSGTQSAIQTGFFSTRANDATGVGGFEPALLDYGFSIRQPVATTEFLSPYQLNGGQLNGGVAQDFRGPVQFVVGEFDFLDCGGDCKGTFDPAMIESLYPKATDVDIYIQEGTGHGLTMHRKADLGYKATLDWLDQHRL